MNVVFNFIYFIILYISYIWEKNKFNWVIMIIYRVYLVRFGMLLWYECYLELFLDCCLWYDNILNYFTHEFELYTLYWFAVSFTRHISIYILHQNSKNETVRVSIASVIFYFLIWNWNYDILNNFRILIFYKIKKNKISNKLDSGSFELYPK